MGRPTGLRALAAVFLAAALTGCGGAAATPPGSATSSAAPNPKTMAAYWDFSSSKSLLGWSQGAVYGMTPTNNYPNPGSSTDTVSLRGDALDAHVTGPDAWILAPNLGKMNLRGSGVGSVLIRLRLQPAAPANTDWIELYWANNITGSQVCCNGEYAPGNWGQNGSISTNSLSPPIWVNGDGNWHTFTLPIQGNTSAFTGHIYGIRIDLEQPQSQAPTDWQVQWIALTKA
jgi:hypothetical protein